MSDEVKPGAVQRHKTAIARRDLSQPMRLLVERGVITEATTVLDYGCGFGDDVQALSDAGVSATGWDPHYRPNARKVLSDVVNIGFVINVIEDPKERAAALREAWCLTGAVLAVSAMLPGQMSNGGAAVLGDGYLTGKGTFQKYYMHGELREYVAETLGVHPVAAGPGIFFVFRDASAQEDFTFAQNSKRRVRPGLFRLPSSAMAEELAAKAPLAVPEIIEFLFSHGRTPAQEELSHAASEELQRARVSLARATTLVVSSAIDTAAFEVARMQRIEDLLVHAALGKLDRTNTKAGVSKAIKRDIKAHFGSQQELDQASDRYLLSLRDEDGLRAGFSDAVERGVAALDGEDRLLVLGDRISQLPGGLRCFIGCATALSGLPPSPLVVRVDARHKKIVLWTIDDIDQAFPTTSTRIIVELKRAIVDVDQDRRRILCKGRLQGLPVNSRQRQLEAAFAAKNPMVQGHLLYKTTA